MTSRTAVDADPTVTRAADSSRLHISGEFDALMERIDQISPLLRDSAEANETAGRLVPEVEHALRNGGVYKIGVPSDLGGYEFSPRQLLETIARLSYADASTGWSVMAVQMETGTLAGWIDADAARRYFPENGEFALFAGQGSRMGKAVKVEGGYRLSGSWQFASGMHQATHIHTAAVVEQTGEPRIFNLPKEQATLVDNWDVMGLRATGSIDYVIDDVFVPEENTYLATIQDNLNGGTIYRLGLANMSGICHAGWAIGVGRRILDEMRAYARTRTGNPGAVVDTDQFHAAFAEAEAKFHAACALVFQTWATNEGVLDRGELLDVDQETWTKLALNHITWTLEDITATVYKWAGTTALRAGTLQRLFRDVHAGTQHITSGPIILQNCGRRLAGLAPKTRWAMISLVDE